MNHDADVADQEDSFGPLLTWPNVSAKVADMVGVREYLEGYTLELRRGEFGRLVIRAYNEAKYNHVEIDLFDLIGWLKYGNGQYLVETGEGTGRHSQADSERP